METIQLHSHIGPDGVLTVHLPVAHTDADKDVLVTIQPLPSEAGTAKDTTEWHQFVEETYGSCAELGLRRHEQGEFEERETVQ